jgi:phosphoserine aminotransferase
VINTLALQDHQYPQLFLRDSSSTIAGRNLGIGNTSRQFISYSPQQKTGEQGFTLAFFGDAIFDRQVSSILSTPAKIDDYFKTFFQKEDPKLALLP